MPGRLKQKYNKNISSVVLVTYAALLMVVSFHFHKICYAEVSFIEAKDITSNFGTDIVHSNGALCQFLLTYKSYADLININSLDFSSRFVQSIILPSIEKYNNLLSRTNISLRAPPQTPYFC